MPTKKRLGAKHKLDRSDKARASGKYKLQAIKTEINRKRKQAKHQRKVEKKAAKKLLF